MKNTTINVSSPRVKSMTLKTIALQGCTGLLALLLAQVSMAQDIIIDPEGVDMGQYQKDLQACEGISSQVQGKGGRGAVRGALVGGAIGAARGNSDTAKKDAGVGAVLGLAGGRSDSKQEQLVVQKNCMRERGYKVLN